MCDTGHWAYYPQMLAAHRPPPVNHFLEFLPLEELEGLLPLERIQMPLGSVLYESGARQDYVYFSTTSIVSLLDLMQDGDSAEISVVEARACECYMVVRREAERLFPVKVA